MSILPLVFAFIVMFSIGAYALLKDLMSCHYEKSIYISFLNTHRDLQSELEKLHYNEAPGKKEHTDPGKKKDEDKEATPSPSQNYYSPRDKKTLHPFAKLNIGQLLVSDSVHASTLLYETAAQLIRALYEKTAVYQPDLEYQILDLFMKAAKEHSSELKLENLTAHILTDPKNKSLYKIFKGTSTYTLFTKAGYPPFADFISIDVEKNKKPVNFQYAPRVLLVALFGDKITDQIVQAEKEKWEKHHRHSSLTKKELAPLLLKDHEKRLNSSVVEPLINFTHKDEKDPNVTATDAQSGINLKAKI